MHRVRGRAGAGGEAAAPRVVLPMARFASCVMKPAPRARAMQATAPAVRPRPSKMPPPAWTNVPLASTLLVRCAKGATNSARPVPLVLRNAPVASRIEFLMVTSALQVVPWESTWTKGSAAHVTSHALLVTGQPAIVPAVPMVQS